MRKIVRDRILKKYNYKCFQCSSTENLEVDHIIPLSRGGRHDEDNLQILCRHCNRKKSSSIDFNKYFKKGDGNSFIYIRRDFPLNSLNGKDFKLLFENKIIELCQ